ncbi:MAG: hypothetical protein HGA44_00250 [Cellulomonadaceae bacterium]|nr:hypothetical protein [Cellulomonadaceae bacterium]
MTLLTILAALIFVTLLAVTARTVGADGYGHRPPPRSHRTWDEDDARPS